MLLPKVMSFFRLMFFTLLYSLSDFKLTHAEKKDVEERFRKTRYECYVFAKIRFVHKPFLLYKYMHNFF